MTGKLDAGQSMAEQAKREMGTTDRKQRRRRFVRMALLSVLALAVLSWIALIAISVTLVPRRGSDFAIYYAAAEVVRFTPATDLYSWLVLVHAAQIHGGCALFPGVRYNYPPLLAILLEPLTLAPCGLAMPIWTVVNALLWGGATALMAWQLAARWSRSRLAAVTVVTVAAACFWQAIWGLWLGQVHFIVLFAIVLAMLLHERGRPTLVGAVLAVAACIKLFPGFLIFYFLLRRDWWVVTGAIVAGAACVLVMCLAVGPSEVVGSLSAAIQVVSGAARPGLNEALIIILPGAGTALAILVFGAFCVGVLAAQGKGSDRLGSAWAICTMLLVSPLVWSYYLVWLLPVFFACLACLDRPWKHKRLLVVLAVLYVAVAFPGPLAFAPLATLVLWTVVGVAFLRSSGLSPHVAVKPGRMMSEQPASAIR